MSRYAYLQIVHFDEFSTASDKTGFDCNLFLLLGVTFTTETAYYWPIIIRSLRQP